MQHVIVGLVALTLGAAAQDQSASSAQVSTQPTNVVQPTPTPSSLQTAPASGKIVMYRGSSVVGAGVACPIRYKEQEVVELARGKYAVWSVPPGRYVLTNHSSSVEVSVDPGESRYVRCQIKMGFLAGHADLQIADEQSFKEHSKDFEEKPVEAISPEANN